jgi:hypothetical protein
MECRCVLQKVVLKQDSKHVDWRLLKETRSHLKELAGEFGGDLHYCFWR